MSSRKLTPEQIEEQKKIEARKDRLHRNYLKRKANGTQKNYYEKTKQKKKELLDSKKLAIRLEDMENGVFAKASQMQGTPTIASTISA